MRPVALTGVENGGNVVRCNLIVTAHTTESARNVIIIQKANLSIGRGPAKSETRSRCHSFRFISNPWLARFTWHHHNLKPFLEGFKLPVQPTL